ncbi:MAG: S41 family peptidase [Candidatus Eremiobacteraeota bacterium]|nr:S41 family peptidase [Candidatus Eremiobacteraeota bacterium]
MKRLSSLFLAAIFAAPLVNLPAASADTPHLAAGDANRIAMSYSDLTTEFYKHVDTQNVLNSVHDELDKTLKARHIDGTIPSLHASDNAQTNVRAIDLAVEQAQHKAHSSLSSRDLSYAAIDGMMRSVNDRYTVFLSPKDYADLNSGLDGGNFGGTGIVIQADDTTKYITVSNVVPDGPADKAGIQQDDQIVSIDGASTKGWSIDRASAHLRGKEGTKVTLGIERAGKTLAPITLTRAQIHQMSVFDKMLPGNIGYVALTVFGKDTSDELNTALDRLQKRGARAYILDLRDNGGGYLEAAVGVSSKFISSGPIVSVESRASSITTLEANDTAISPVPLVVLVNGHTASASEITSGAIQDSGVGTIMGTKTFGKGVVQTIFPLGDGSAVKITTARYLTPHNRDINHLGITPDVVVEENAKPRFGDPTKDTQLQRAVQYIDDRIAHLNDINGTGTSQ